MKAKVAVDVFSWITAAIDHPSIPIEGIYRHAESLALKFLPVCWFTAADHVKYPAFSLAKERLERHLKKQIQVFVRHEQVIAQRFNVWLSIGLDSPAPILKDLPAIGVYRVAVLHDTMAYYGYFGAGNEDTFKFGTANNDMVLPVSQTAYREYLKLDGKVPVIRNSTEYGCFHNFEVLPVPRSKRMYTVSVGTEYPRKRIPENARFSRKLMASSHQHIGRIVNPDDLTYIAETPYLKRHGFLSDKESQAIVSEAFAYINMSEKEGFSMPPLEAMLLGVQYLFLSPVDAHTEVYRGVANFYEPDEEPKSLKYCHAVTAAQRAHYFNKYRFCNVIKPFERFIG